MYQSLIRPIITYACPIWFNISPSYMQKLRIFERKCLRSCTKLYRSSHSNYIKYVSNKKLYNAANIIRIDNFIIHLIRRHILRCTKCTVNNLIMGPCFPNDVYIVQCLNTGFVPPEAFIYLDKNGYIQNQDQVPLFYHRLRRATVKRVSLDTHGNDIYKYDCSISLRDSSNAGRNNYWWLEQYHSFPYYLFNFGLFLLFFPSSLFHFIILN